MINNFFSRKIIPLILALVWVSPPFTPSANGESPFDKFQDDYRWLVQMNNPKTFLTLTSLDPSNPHNSYTYSNAISLILLVLRGTNEDMQLAKEIVHGLKKLQDEDGPWADSFHVQTGQITAWNRATGPNGWMILALLHYYKKTRDPVALEMAHTTTEWLLTHQDIDRNHFTYGGIKLGHAYPYSEVRNTEANCNALAALYAMSVFTKKPLDRIRYREAARMVAQFLTEKIWQNDYFAVAFLNSKGNLSSFPELLDSQTWTILSLAATRKLHGISPRQFAGSMNWILKYTTRANKAEGFSKVTFSYDPHLDLDGDGDVDNSIWVEGVAGTVLAFRAIGEERRANFYYNELEKLKLPTGRYPHIIGPVKLSWPHHLPFASIGALWVIFADPEINFNPFHVSD